MNPCRPFQWSSRCRAGALYGILILGLLEQGCFAAAWLAAVGADSLRTSHVAFERFEASWVSSEIPNTALHIETTAERIATPPLPHRDEDGRSVIAQQVSRELTVDAVLFGHVTGTQYPAGDWEWRAQEHRRLYLYLIDRDGHLLWRDELPFIVVTGSKPPLEGSVQASLAHHLMDHVRALGLDRLGYLPDKTS